MNESFHKLTDSQWQIIEKLLDDKRQRRHSLRTIVNAILWLNYTGLHWRELSKLTGPQLPWQSVYYHFRQFNLKGIWEQILDSLVIKERKRQERASTPSLLAKALRLCSLLTKKRAWMVTSISMAVNAPSLLIV